MRDYSTENKLFSRSITEDDFSELSFTPWEAADAAVNPAIPYTVMIYMNGSDLESKEGAATADISELLASGVDPSSANIVIFTGGTNYWHNSLMEPGECAVWKISRPAAGFPDLTDNRGEQLIIEKLHDLGRLNMGDAGTLSSFISYCLKHFPAEKFGLILWDHGGGSVAGYGHDEIFAGNSLTLLELNYAFGRSGLGGETKLEFLGFDSCLMATVEMAVIAADYAAYMIASEDIEPTGGWDYRFISVLNRPGDLSGYSPGNPPDGTEVGRAVTDSFMDFYGESYPGTLALSVTDLSCIREVMSAMGNLMNRCSAALAFNFDRFAKRRALTKSFGISGNASADSDMIDLADAARTLADLYPSEASELFKAIGEAVIYNRHNSPIALGGLSSYYIYHGAGGGPDIREALLAAYASLQMSPEYTAYLHDFAAQIPEGFTLGVMEDHARSSTMRSYTAGSSAEQPGSRGKILLLEPIAENMYLAAGEQDADQIRRSGGGILWPAIITGGVSNPVFIRMRAVGASLHGIEYAVPAQINGRDADIIIFANTNSREFRVIGYRSSQEYIKQKGNDEFRGGDTVAVYYNIVSCGADGAESFITGGRRLSDKFTVQDTIGIEWRSAAGLERYSPGGLGW